MLARSLLIGGRLLVGTLIVTAIVVQAVYLQMSGVFNPFNYLGYFTNLSNIVAGGIFIVSALYVVKNRKPTAKDDLVRGAATFYMAVTGTIYITLLTGEDLGLLMPWVNVVTHIVAPVAIVADWLYRPPRSKLGIKQICLWLIFPFVYVTYTLVRGAITGWYPYPFLDPDKAGGYAGVALYSLGILAAFFFLAWTIVTVGAKRAAAVRTSRR